MDQETKDFLIGSAVLVGMGLAGLGILGIILMMGYRVIIGGGC